MAAADVVVTSSGDTCREARAVGRRLVLLDVVPGHGRENLMHELELGGALVASLDPESLADTVAVALADVPEPSPVGSAAEWGAQFGAALSAIGFALA
jgi:UDP-N-acetylglucosamine:LPS N-acetylglucosamine transferase